MMSCKEFVKWETTKKELHLYLLLPQQRRNFPNFACNAPDQDESPTTAEHSGLCVPRAVISDSPRDTCSVDCPYGKALSTRFEAVFP